MNKRFITDRPCANCPFLRDGGIRLSPGRITEIAEHSGHFTCHKTTVFHEDDGDEEDNNGRPHRNGELVCAGWAAFNIRRGDGGQLWRIFGRTGGFKNIEAAQWLDEVFLDLDEAEARSLR